jgi:hypothetical protein
MQFGDVEKWAGGFSNTLTLITTVATFLAVLVAIWQLRDTNKTVKGQFWLMLRSVMTQYDDIHANFRPRGKWHGSSTHPDTVSDWARTELYMGLLEYCDELIADGLLDKRHFKNWYEYRIRNLLSNPRVVTYKLHDNADGWQKFYILCKRISINIPPATKGLSPFIRDDPPGNYNERATSITAKLWPL